jgi:hypothetical protein
MPAPDRARPALVVSAGVGPDWPRRTRSSSAIQSPPRPVPQNRLPRPNRLARVQRLDQAHSVQRYRTISSITRRRLDRSRLREPVG